MQETEEPAKKKTTEQEEEEESEVKRIERELESSADELCQGAAASVSTSASGSTSASPSVPAADENDLNGDSQEETDQAAAVVVVGADSPDDPEASATATVAAAGSTSDDLEDILCDMMIQTSSPHFQHPRQPMQNYGHGMHGSLRQGGYHHHHHHHHHQVSGNFTIPKLKPSIQWIMPWEMRWIWIFKKKKTAGFIIARGYCIELKSILWAFLPFT